MKRKLVCIETGKWTRVNLSPDKPWDCDDKIDYAANLLLKRESNHKHDYVNITMDNLRSEIKHALPGGLAEHTGKYRTFKLIDTKQ